MCFHVSNLDTHDVKVILKLIIIKFSQDYVIENNNYRKTLALFQIDFRVVFRVSLIGWGVNRLIARL